MDKSLYEIKLERIKHYSKRFNLDETDVEMILDSDPVDFAMRVYAALKLIAERLDKLEESKKLND